MILGFLSERADHVSAREGLLSIIEPSQRCFRIESLADAVHVEGVVPAVCGERAIAQCAQTVDGAVSVGGVNLQAGVIILMKWAEIQPTPFGRSSTIVLDHICYVMDLVVPGDS